MHKFIPLCSGHNNYSPKGIVYIMRGIPGSGKSTVARLLAGKFGAIHSTDSYFYQEGRYSYDPKLLSDYHKKNFDAFCQSLADSIEIVICDNTNIQIGHFQQYIEMAFTYGYRVVIVEMDIISAELAALRNNHEVPLPAIHNMIARWEIIN